MNKFLKICLIVVLALIVVYGIFAVSGLTMFLLLAATAPITNQWENLAFDYAVWAIIGAAFSVPMLLAMRRNLSLNTVQRVLLRTLVALVVGYLVGVTGVLAPWPAWFASASAPVFSGLIVVGFYYYTKRILK